MGGEIRGKEVSKESVGHPGRESVLGERGDLPAESQFGTMGADLAAGRRFGEGKRNALEMEFNRSFEQFQRLAARKPGEQGKLNIPGYRPITVEDFLFGIKWAEKAFSGLNALKSTAQGTLVKAPADDLAGEPGAKVKVPTDAKAESPDVALSAPVLGDSGSARVVTLYDGIELARAYTEGTKGPDIFVVRGRTATFLVRGRNTTQRLDSYYTKMRNFASRNEVLVVDTYVTSSGKWVMSGSVPNYELFIDTTDPDLVLKIHQLLVEKCIATGSEPEAWQWLLRKSPYSHLLSRSDFED